MRIIILFLLLSMYSTAYSQTVEVNAIVKSDYEVFTIYSSDKAQLDIKKEILIINNRAAKSLQNISLTYDDFHKISDVKVEIINPSNNKVIEDFNLKDFEDINYDFTNLATDARQKRLQLNKKSFPFIIKYSYSIQYNGLLHYPIWLQNPTSNTRIEKCNFMVIDETKNTFRFKTFGIDEPKTQENDDANFFVWEFEDLPAREYELYSKKVQDFTPYIICSPQQFMIEGYEGKMDSWENFGDWIAQLNEGKNDLVYQKLSSLNEKLAPARSKIDSIKIIYDYLQSNSRYISLQLGIGGWQPLSASFVHEKKYGDCKALSNYTKSILELYNIESFYTLINGGKPSDFITPDFATPYFNHAILTVPVENDTLFLECTSQTNPFAYLGTFTSNRFALIIKKDNKSKLIRTKKYQASDNQQKQKIIVNMISNKESVIQKDVELNGLEIENHNFLRLYNQDSTEQLKWFKNTLGAGNKIINSFNLKDLEEGFVPVGGYSATYKSGNEIKVVGKRFFINLSNYFDSYLTKLPQNTERRGEINIQYGYNQADTVIINLPENQYIIENLSNDTFLETDYGVYYRNIKVDNNAVIITRNFKLNDGDYKPSEYEDFRHFSNAVMQYDKEKLVIIKQY